MQPEIGLDDWSNRREPLLIGLGLWLVGFAFAGLAVWQMQRAPRALDGAIQTDTFAPAPQGAAVMPEDTVVGRREPVIGATQMQEQSPSATPPQAR